MKKSILFQNIFFITVSAIPQYNVQQENWAKLDKLQNGLNDIRNGRLRGPLKAKIEQISKDSMLGDMEEMMGGFATMQDKVDKMWAMHQQMIQDIRIPNPSDNTMNKFTNPMNSMVGFGTWSPAVTVNGNMFVNNPQMPQRPGMKNKNDMTVEEWDMSAYNFVKKGYMAYKEFTDCKHTIEYLAVAQIENITNVDEFERAFFGQEKIDNQINQTEAEDDSKMKNLEFTGPKEFPWGEQLISRVRQREKIFEKLGGKSK